jgi:hypothetical protein
LTCGLIFWELWWYIRINILTCWELWLYIYIYMYIYVYPNRFFL